MSTVTEIEEAIERLPQAERESLESWLLSRKSGYFFYIQTRRMNAQTSGIHKDPEVYLPGLAGVANPPGLI